VFIAIGYTYPKLGWETGQCQLPAWWDFGADAFTRQEGTFMRKSGARFFTWTVGLMASALLTGQACAQDKVRFVLDWAFQGQQAMFTLPVDDGTYQRHGLAVIVDRGVGSGDSVAKVASGAYDIALADLYSMVRFNGANPDRPLIAVMLVHDKSALAV